MEKWIHRIGERTCFLLEFLKATITRFDTIRVEVIFGQRGNVNRDVTD